MTTLTTQVSYLIICKVQVIQVLQLFKYFFWKSFK